jgi:hypothetical protein
MLQRKDLHRVPFSGKIRIIQEAPAAECRYKTPGLLKTRNISLGGLCVVSDIEICRDTVMETEIFLQPGGVKNLHAFCRVAWSKKTQKENGYETGMQFLGVKDRACDFIKEFVNSKLPNFQPEKQ